MSSVWDMETLTEDERFLVEKTAAAKEEHVFTLLRAEGIGIVFCDLTLEDEEGGLFFDTGVYLINHGLIKEDEDGTLYACADKESLSAFKRAIVGALRSRKDRSFDYDDIRGIDFEKIPIPDTERSFTLGDVLFAYAVWSSEDETERERMFKALESFRRREAEEGSGELPHDDIAAKPTAEPIAKRRKYIKRLGDGFYDTSAVINAITQPSNQYYQTADRYFSGVSTSIPTGEGREVVLSVSSQDEREGEVEHANLTGVERYWLDGVNSIAYSGEYEIRGSKLLEHKGYENPYQPSMATTMGEAATAIGRMMFRGISYDATKDRKGKPRDGMELTSSIGLTQIIQGKLYLETYDNGEKVVKDFVLELANKDNPVESLPALVYSIEHGNYFQDEPLPRCFKGMRLGTKHRMAWDHIRRQLRAEKLENTVLLDTLFATIDETFEDSKEGKRRKRAFIKMLSKMLDAAKDGGTGNKKRPEDRKIASWRLRERNGKPDAFIIKRLEDEKDGNQGG